MEVEVTQFSPLKWTWSAKASCFVFVHEEHRISNGCRFMSKGIESSYGGFSPLSSKRRISGGRRRSREAVVYLLGRIEIFRKC